MGIYAVPDSQILKFTINLNRVLHIYLVSSSFYMKYPELVTKLTTLCSGWLVGSSANPNETEPRDYDVYIPIKYWLEASNYIPKDAKINRMGGFKCISDGVEVDVWTGDMNDFLASNYFNFAFQPKTGVRIGRL